MMERRWIMHRLHVLALAGMMARGSTTYAQAPTYEVETTRNVPYVEGPDADPIRHKLDLHLPKGAKNFPVLFFVHGGGWVQGHKDQLSMYSMLGKTLSRQ